MERVSVRVVAPDISLVRCAFCHRELVRVLAHRIEVTRLSTGYLGNGESVQYACSADHGAVIAQRIDPRLLHHGARPLQPLRRARLTSR